MSNNLPNTSRRPTAHKDYRSACDRCRGQKLRCLREDEGQRACRRCQKAQVECISSPPMHIDRRRTLKSNRTRSETYPHEANTAEHVGASSAASHIEFEDLSEILGPFPYSPETLTNTQYPIDASNSFQCWNGSGATPSPTFSNFHFDNLSCMGGGGLEYPQNEEGQHFRAQLPDMAGMAPPALTPPCSEGLDTNELHQLGKNQDWSQFHSCPPLELTTPVETADRPVNAGKPTPPTYRSANITEEGQCIQQLSELNQLLYLQLKALEDDSWACCLPSFSLISGSSNSGTPTEADTTKPVGDILSSSEGFVALISKFLLPEQAHKPSESMPASPHAKDPRPSDAPASYTKLTKLRKMGPSRSTNEPSKTSRHGTHSAPNPISMVSIDSPPRHGDTFPLYQLDVPTILLILSCYVRIVSIYAKLFSHINKYLSLAPDTASQAKFSQGQQSIQTSQGLHSRSPLQIGGFSLHSYGNIQIKILVEISIHFIAQIQDILEVPRRDRLKNDCWDAVEDSMDWADGEDEEEESKSCEEESSCTEFRIRSLLDIVTMVVELDRKNADSRSGGGIVALRGELTALQKTLSRVTQT